MTAGRCTRHVIHISLVIQGNNCQSLLICHIVSSSARVIILEDSSSIMLVIIKFNYFTLRKINLLYSLIRGGGVPPPPQSDSDWTCYTQMFGNEFKAFVTVVFSHPKRLTSGVNTVLILTILTCDGWFYIKLLPDSTVASNWKTFH